MRRNPAWLAVALLASLASLALAADTYPPGPPYRSCPDSVTIFQIQQSDTTLNPCYPVIADTVQGVRGIITAFRYRSTGRIYFENSNAAPYNGLQAYTISHLETAGLALGDSISVTGLSQAYQNESQLQGSMGTSLTVRKISSGNALPPAHVGTTTDFNWAPATGPSYATANPYEGMLVRVNGPLRVARTQGGAGLYSGINWLLVNGDGSAPGDSILIDGYTLTSSNILAPPLGYTVGCVQGILRRGMNNGTDAWIITLRDENCPPEPPPNLSEAYPVAENQIRLVFDTSLDVTTAEDETNYQLGSVLSGSTVDVATVVGGAGNVVDLTITEVLSRLSLESIATSGIGKQTCPTCLSGSQSLSFILGILTPAEVQAPLADSLAGSPCLDKSRFAGGGSSYGSRLTVRSIYEGVWGSLYYFAGVGGGLRNGVTGYNVPASLTVGNQYLLACRVQEWYTEAELANFAAVIDEGATTIPAPIVETVAVLADGSCDAAQAYTNAEDYEGVLVKVVNCKVVGFNGDDPAPDSGGSFRVVQMSACTDTILVSALGGSLSHYNFYPKIGMLVDVTGILHIDSDSPRILPRDNADIYYYGGCAGVESVAPLQMALRVEPNPGVSHRVTFVVPRSKDKVEVGVFDLMGRRVAQLARGEMIAGEYSCKWDGRTSSGAKATAGVYFYQLKVGSDVRVVRAVKLNW